MKGSTRKSGMNIRVSVTLNSLDVAPVAPSCRGEAKRKTVGKNHSLISTLPSTISTIFGPYKQAIGKSMPLGFLVTNHDLRLLF